MTNHTDQIAKIKELTAFILEHGKKIAELAKGQVAFNEEINTEIELIQIAHKERSALMLRVPAATLAAELKTL